MIKAINIAMLGLLLWIFFEDLRDRQISLFAILALIVLAAIQNFRHHILELAMVVTLINICVIAIIMFSLWLYAKYKLRKKLFEVFGTGDLLFFVFLAVGFPTPTFLILLSGSLIFAFLMSIAFKKKLTRWVPLAGLQALFVAFVVGVNELGQITNLYAF